MTDTILIVDDDSSIREIFTIYLEMAGYRTFTAAGGAECLDLLKTHIPDLILLDLMMEPMDGWETLLEIRHSPSTIHIPVIIITGKSPTSEDFSRYCGLIEDFIVKPVDFKQIAESLHCIIEKNRDLGLMTAQKKGEGQDPALIAEYPRLLRHVRSTNHLLKKFENIPCSDTRVSLKRNEERLMLLHTGLGFPDHLLERDEWG